jgi:chitinase
MLTSAFALLLDCTSSENLNCGVNTQLLTAVRCSLAASGSVQYRSLCCPFGNTPDPAFCEWRAGSNPKAGFCTPGCNQGEIPFATSSWAEIDEGPVRCFSGYASYCCKAVESGPSVCGWNPTCTTLGSNGKPNEDGACPPGRDFITYAASGAGYYCDGNSGKPNTWLSFCCDSGANPDYKWVGSGGAPHFCDDNKNCPDGYISYGLMSEGDGQNCEYESPPTVTGSGYPIYVGRTLCVDASAVSLTVNNLPVPLANLFPTPGPSSDKQTWNVELDPSMGGADPVPNGSTDPNENSFGWHIMSGPSDEITTMSKRDGSHWDVYDCEHTGTERQTAKAVCIDDSEDSKCGIIFMGRGVAETVVEMPPGCGAGKYAMAISLEPAANQTLPHRLVKRGLRNPVVHDFTFDYDFTPLQRRQSESNVLLRIDYSDDPGYWNNIVGELQIVRAGHDDRYPLQLTPSNLYHVSAASPKHRRKSKRDMEDLSEVVKREHGGSWKRYVEHEWLEDKRSTPEHELHLLHERWFSADLADWLSKMYTIDHDYKLFRHSIDQQLRWFLFEDSITCTLFGIPAEAYFAAWADLNILIDTSAQLTLIGNLGDLSSFQESHLLVRNSGSVKASLNIEALGTLKFTTGQIELVGSS